MVRKIKTRKKQFRRKNPIKRRITSKPATLLKMMDVFSFRKLKQFGGELDDEIYHTNYSPPEDLEEDEVDVEENEADEEENEEDEADEPNDIEENEENEEDEADEKNEEPNDIEEKEQTNSVSYNNTKDVNDIDGIETVEYDRKRMNEIFTTAPNTIFEMNPENNVYYNHGAIFDNENDENTIEIKVLYEFSIYKTTLLNRIPVPLIDNNLLSTGSEIFKLPENMVIQEFLDRLMYSANKTVFPKLGLLSVPSYKINGIIDGKMFSELKREDNITSMPKVLHIDIEYRLRETA